MRKDIKNVILCGATAFLLLSVEAAMAQEKGQPFVRLAELEIDLAHIELFKSAVREEVDASVRVEPGVLALHVVFVKDQPSLVRVFEIYTDEEAYRFHLETPHFKKFRDATNAIVKSRKLFDAVPIVLGAKPR